MSESSTCLEGSARHLCTHLSSVENWIDDYHEILSNVLYVLCLFTDNIISCMLQCQDHYFWTLDSNGVPPGSRTLRDLVTLTTLIVGNSERSIIFFPTRLSIVPAILHVFDTLPLYLSEALSYPRRHCGRGTLTCHMYCLLLYEHLKLGREGSRLETRFHHSLQLSEQMTFTIRNKYIAALLLTRNKIRLSCLIDWSPDFSYYDTLRNNPQLYVTFAPIEEEEERSRRSVCFRGSVVVRAVSTFERKDRQFELCTRSFENAMLLHSRLDSLDRYKTDDTHSMVSQPQQQPSCSLHDVVCRMSDIEQRLTFRNTIFRPVRTDSLGVVAISRYTGIAVTHFRWSEWKSIGRIPTGGIAVVDSLFSGGIELLWERHFVNECRGDGAVLAIVSEALVIPVIDAFRKRLTGDFDRLIAEDIRDETVSDSTRLAIVSFRTLRRVMKQNNNTANVLGLLGRTKHMYVVDPSASAGTTFRRLLENSMGKFGDNIHVWALTTNPKRYQNSLFQCVGYDTFLETLHFPKNKIRSSTSRIAQLVRTPIRKMFTVRWEPESVGTENITTHKIENASIQEFTNDQFQNSYSFLRGKRALCRLLELVRLALCDVPVNICYVKTARSQCTQRIGRNVLALLDPVRKSTKSRSFSVESDSCPLCMSAFVDPLQLSCGHVLCHDCCISMIEYGDKDKQNCAVCRSNLVVTKKRKRSVETYEPTWAKSTALQIEKPTKLSYAESFVLNTIRQFPESRIAIVMNEVADCIGPSLDNHKITYQTYGPTTRSAPTSSAPVSVLVLKGEPSYLENFHFNTVTHLLLLDPNSPYTRRYISYFQHVRYTMPKSICIQSVLYKNTLEDFTWTHHNPILPLRGNDHPWTICVHYALSTFANVEGTFWNRITRLAKRISSSCNVQFINFEYVTLKSSRAHTSPVNINLLSERIEGTNYSLETLLERSDVEFESFLYKNNKK